MELYSYAISYLFNFHAFNVFNTFLFLSKDYGMPWQKTEDPFNIKLSSYSQANIILPKAIVLNIHAHFKDQDCEQNGTLNLLSI